MSRFSKAWISANALVHNFHRIKSVLNEQKVWSVVKANAYGHGSLSVAKTLAPYTDGFAVAHFEEAELLRLSGIKQPILLLEGVSSSAQLVKLPILDIETVVHNEYGFNLLIDTLPQLHSEDQILKVWLKMDTGMNRLGIAANAFSKFVDRAEREDKVDLRGIMTHFACADEEHHLNQKQLMAFDQAKSKRILPESIANSALIFSNPETYRDWVRPGIALYGSSPFKHQDAKSIGLKPVMKLVSKVISLKEIQPGDSVGYGATWTSESRQEIAVVGIGYGDGYPRHVKGAQVWLKGHLCPIVGRVSMDMLTVLIPQRLQVQIGDEVECWGEHISVDTVAEQAGTIGYELLCQVTSRVPRVHTNEFNI